MLVTGCGGAATALSTPALAAPRAGTIEGVARLYLALSPGIARGAGLHEYDGEVAPVAAADIERRVLSLRALEQEVAGLEAAATSDDERLDCKMLAQSLAQELFDPTEVESWRTRPLYYSMLFSVEAYIVRDYAPKTERAHALIQHVRAALAEVQHVKKNLRLPPPESVVRTSSDAFAGFADTGFVVSDVEAVSSWW